MGRMCGVSILKRNYFLSQFFFRLFLIGALWKLNQPKRLCLNCFYDDLEQISHSMPIFDCLLFFELKNKSKNYPIINRCQFSNRYMPKPEWLSKHKKTKSKPFRKSNNAPSPLLSNFLFTGNANQWSLIFFNIFCTSSYVKFRLKTMRA